MTEIVSLQQNGLINSEICLILLVLEQKFTVYLCQIFILNFDQEMLSYT